MVSVISQEALRILFHYKGEKMAVASSNTDLHGYGKAIRGELGRRIPRDKKLRVLDVGTGFGINVAFLTGWLSKGSAVWTVDPSKEVLEDVKASLQEESARLVRFAVATADDLDFQDGFFDYVVSVMVLHHIEKLQPALKEMARVLKPGGRLIVVDYKPQASHELEFRTRHEEADFFEPALVVRGLERLRVKATPVDFGLWYLVDGKKASVLSRRRSGRSARGKRNPRASPGQRDNSPNAESMKRTNKSRATTKMTTMTVSSRPK